MDPSLVFLLAFALVIPTSISQCTEEKALPFFKRSVYEFTVDLVKRVALENENHFVTSALSPWTLLSVLSLGATDETLAEIKQVLRMHEHKCFNKKFFAIVEKLTHKQSDATFERSAIIFADERMPLLDGFKTKVQMARISEIREMNFYDPTAANTINNYVSEATHGNINEIVEQSDLEDALLILIDALYFKAAWKDKLEEAEVSAFYDQAGNQIGDVNLCFKDAAEANMSYVSQIGAKVLELPYKDDRFSMLFILPEEGETVVTVLDKMKDISLKTIFTTFSNYGLQNVLIQIPRFKMHSNLDNMKEWLIDMGLTTTFDPQSASFGDMSQYKLFVNDFIQKATIEVTEEGTEASVVSTAFVSGRSMPKPPEQFTANKPFLFMIIERELELVLFAGAYSKPSVY